MYSINFTRLITDLLPACLRKPVIIAWLEALLYPVSSLYGAWIDYFSEKRFDARITGQIAYLQYMLNLKFYGSGALTSIYIDDGDDEDDEVFLFNTAENEEELLIFNSSETSEGNTYLFNTSEVGVYDFIVMVPLAPQYDADHMKSLINKYKLAGKTYIIQTY